MMGSRAADGAGGGQLTELSSYPIIWPVDHELQLLNAIADPAERAQRALAAIEDGRALMEKAAETRARAALELYQKHGAAKAARLLGTSRVNLYRIMGQLPRFASSDWQRRLR